MNKKMIKKSITLKQLDEEMNWSEQDKKDIGNFKAYFEALEQLRIVKEEAGITNQELSNRTGISRPQVSNVLNGKRNATLETLMRIASSLNKRIEIRVVE